MNIHLSRLSSANASPRKKVKSITKMSVNVNFSRFPPSFSHLQSPNHFSQIFFPLFEENPIKVYAAELITSSAVGILQQFIILSSLCSSSDLSMSTNFWAPRLVAAKRQYALQHHHNSSQLGFVLLLISSMHVRFCVLSRNWVLFFAPNFFWVRSSERRWLRGWGRESSRFSLSLLLWGIWHRLFVFASGRRAFVRIKSNCTWVCFSRSSFFMYDIIYLDGVFWFGFRL